MQLHQSRDPRSALMRRFADYSSSSRCLNFPTSSIDSERPFQSFDCFPLGCVRFFHLLNAPLTFPSSSDAAARLSETAAPNILTRSVNALFIREAPSSTSLRWSLSAWSELIQIFSIWVPESRIVSWEVSTFMPLRRPKRNRRYRIVSSA